MYLLCQSLDPTLQLPSFSLPAALRLQVLLHGDILIPRQFLIHNTNVLLAWNTGFRTDFTAMCEHYPPSLSDQYHYTNSNIGSFSAYLDASFSEHHPFLDYAITSGVTRQAVEAVALELDDLLSESSARSSIGVQNSQAVLGFHDCLTNAIQRSEVSYAAYQTAQKYAEISFLEYQKFNPQKHEWNRNDLFRGVNHAVANTKITIDERTQILNCARVAYAYGFLHGKSADVDTRAFVQTPPGFRLSGSAPTPPIGEGVTDGVAAMLASGSLATVPMSFHSLGNVPWAAISEYLSERGSVAAQRYRGALKAYHVTPGPTTLEKLADETVVYLKDLSKELLPADSRSSNTAQSIVLAQTRSRSGYDLALGIVGLGAGFAGSIAGSAITIIAMLHAAGSAANKILKHDEARQRKDVQVVINHIAGKRTESGLSSMGCDEVSALVSPISSK